VIAESTGGDLFTITTVTPYPDDYASMLRVAQEEIDTDARPELAFVVENMDDYDVIFIGYPIWHGRMPQAIYTFLESYDLTGKTVIPFNTHEGSGQSGTQRVIENALPGSTVLQGLAVQGKTAQEDAERTQTLVDQWLEGLGLERANTEEAAVLAAYEAIQQAMIDKDIDTLDRMILDGTTFTHMSGKTQTKEEFFGEIADGTLNYYAYVIHDPQITVSGDEATMTASVTLTAKVYGASGDWTLPVNAHFTKIDGVWYSHN
jgi:flavodoxin